MKNVKAHTRHSVITEENLARKMKIGSEKAKQMAISTTQKGIRTAVQPITRRYRVYHLDLHTSILSGKWNADWISAGTKWLSQNAGDFVFSERNFHRSGSQ